MPNLLISGPAGANKTAEARRLVATSSEPMVAADFQSLLAAIMLLERQSDGRYPRRLDSQASWLLPLVEYTRMAVIGAAAARGIGVVTTNSDGSPERRALLLSRLGPGAVERVIDPSRSIVTERLSNPDGTIDEQCVKALDRWYSRRV